MEMSLTITSNPVEVATAMAWRASLHATTSQLAARRHLGGALLAGGAPVFQEGGIHVFQANHGRARQLELAGVHLVHGYANVGGQLALVGRAAELVRDVAGRAAQLVGDAAHV